MSGHLARRAAQAMAVEDKRLEELRVENRLASIRDLEQKLRKLDPDIDVLEIRWDQEMEEQVGIVEGIVFANCWQRFGLRIAGNCPACGNRVWSTEIFTLEDLGRQLATFVPGHSHVCPAQKPLLRPGKEWLDMLDRAEKAVEQGDHQAAVSFSLLASAQYLLRPSGNSRAARKET
jgi:hypothetical protein